MSILLAVAGGLAVSAQAQLTVSTIPTSGLNEPSGLAEDSAGNLYLSDSGNNRIMQLDATTLTLSVLAGTGSTGTNDGPGYAATLNNPHGLILADSNTLVVADYGNNMIRSIRISDGYVTTLAGQITPGPATNAAGLSATFRYPVGLTLDSKGNIYIADYGNSVIRVMNWNDPARGVTNLVLDTALHRPAAVAFASSNQLWVADSGATGVSDNTIRLFTLSTPTSGTLTTRLGGNSVTVAGGFKDHALGASALFNLPQGLLWVDQLGLLICDTGNSCVRLATNNPTYGATNYSVVTFAGTPLTTGTADGQASVATFVSPVALVLRNANSFVLVDNGGTTATPMRTIQNGSEDYTPAPTPAVGYLDVVENLLTGAVRTVLETSFPPTFQNDVDIALGDPSGMTIYFTYGDTETGVFGTNWETADAYLSPQAGIVMPRSVMSGLPVTWKTSLTIMAYAVTPSRPPSTVAYGTFNFQVGPVYNSSPDSLDPLHIQLATETTNATIYYTLDGTVPTTSSSSVPWNFDGYLSIPGSAFNNGMVTLKAVAKRGGYADSAVHTEVYYYSNSVVDVTLSPTSGYYPMGQLVRITCPGTNVYYTMDGTDPTTNSILVTDITNVGPTSCIGFIHWNNSTNDLSSLRISTFVTITNSITTGAGQAVPTGDIGVPTGFSTQLAAGIGSTIVVPVVCDLPAGQQIESYQFRLEIVPVNNANTPAFLPLSIYPTNDFVPLTTAAQAGSTATYTYSPYTVGLTNGMQIYAIGSSTHVLFSSHAVVALMEVQIPYDANSGDTYSINVLDPSATSDGYHATVSLTPLPAMTIVVTNLPYTVGDSASPNGAWYNAGTFGNTNLDNADVNQAFYAASGLRVPYSFSDVYNAMDAYPPDETGLVGGDGQIRFLDWITILNRALRMDPNNWSREWSADGYLIDFASKLSAHTETAPATKTLPQTNSAAPWFQVLLGADSVSGATPNSPVYVPVYAKLANGSSLSGLQFRTVVTPEGDAPALTVAPQFMLASGVGSPLFAQSFKAGESAFGWSLGSFNFASRSSNFLGWVSFTVPTNAVAGQCYQVSFANADGAPNATNQYDFETRSATVGISTSAPPASICSDEWKTYYFGSTTNPAAADTADPDGDGVPNWMEYLAGTNPTNAPSRLALTGSVTNLVKHVASMQLNWTTPPRRAYALQWSAGLNGSGWTTLTNISNVSGSGLTNICTDINPGGTARFYRLQVLP